MQALKLFSIFILASLLPIFTFASCGSKCGSGICWFSVGKYVLWVALTSALLFFTWNKVIAMLYSMKEVKFWQALLVVLTVAAFMAPRYMAKKSYHKYGHGYSKCSGKSCSMKRHHGGKSCPHKKKEHSKKAQEVEESDKD